MFCEPLLSSIQDFAGLQLQKISDCWNSGRFANIYRLPNFIGATVWRSAVNVLQVACYNDRI